MNLDPPDGVAWALNEREKKKVSGQTRQILFVSQTKQGPEVDEGTYERSFPSWWQDPAWVYGL